MKKGTIKLLLISTFILISLIVFVKSYSSLSSVNEGVNNKETDINVQLNKKREQIDNICGLYKEYSKDEEMIENLEELNQKLKNSMDISIKAKEKINKNLSNIINQLFDKIDDELLNDERIVSSINELLKTEKRLITAKNNYNEAVENYNSKVKSFPTSIIASFRGFKTKDKFESIKIKNILEGEE